MTKKYQTRQENVSHLPAVSISQIEKFYNIYTRCISQSSQKSPQDIQSYEEKWSLENHFYSFHCQQKHSIFYCISFC